MKYALLIFTLIYLWSIVNSSCIKRFKTLKEGIDNSIKESEIDLESKERKHAMILTIYIFSIIPLLYLLLSAIFINKFLFAVVSFGYMAWSIIDLNNLTKYINKGVVSKTFNSRFYKFVSTIFDLLFAVFMLYQIFIKW